MVTNFTFIPEIKMCCKVLLWALILLSRCTYVYAGFTGTSPPLPDSIAVKFNFRINHDDLDFGYLNNARTLRTLDSVYLSTRLPYIRQINVTVATSPEGALTYNLHLNESRISSIKKFLSSRYPYYQAAQHVFKVLPINWKSIYTAVSDDPEVPGKEKLLEVLRSDIDGKETIIRQIAGGRAFNYLLNKQLRERRAVEVEMLFSIHESGGSVTTQPMATVDIPKTDYKIASGSDYYTDSLRVHLKTNLLYDLALMPNLQVELPLGAGFSVNGTWIMPWWNAPKKPLYLQQHTGELELRYWWKKKTNFRNYMNGWFGGLFAGKGTFDFIDGERGYRGENYWMAGLSLGYTHKIASGLGLEYVLGLGYMQMNYRQFDYIDNCYYWKSDSKLNWVGPVKAAVNLIWTPSFFVQKRKL